MKTLWINEVKQRVAKKASIDPNRYRSIEEFTQAACKKLDLKYMPRENGETITSYVGRLVRYFDLGRDCDGQSKYKSGNKRKRITFNNIKSAY